MDDANQPTLRYNPANEITNIHKYLQVSLAEKRNKNVSRNNYNMMMNWTSSEIMMYSPGTELTLNKL
jgi:hypothetical protein